MGNFIGVWSLEEHLIKWIQYWWKPKGHVELKLGSDSFFAAIFGSLEDKDRIFESGTNFFKSIGLQCLTG